MATSDPVGAFTDAARASITKAQSCLVDGWPLGGRDGLRVVLDPEEMLRVIETARPSLVYIDESTFDAEDEAGAAHAALGMDEETDAEVVATFAEVIRRSAKSNGDPTRSLVGFVCEGVLHIAQVTAPWYDALEDEVEGKVAELLAERSAGDAIRDTEDARKIRRLARELANNPAFNLGRPSFEKRLFLAGELFPGHDDQTLSRITTDAQNIDWAAKGGVAVRD